MMNLINLNLILVILISPDSNRVGNRHACSLHYEASLSNFADKLFIDGKYNSAITEYERLNFFSSSGDDHPAPYFKYQIGMCYWKLGKLEHASTVFKELDSLRELTQIYLELGEYSLARFVCEDLECSSALDKNLVGWIYIAEGRWDEAAQVFDTEELKATAFKAKGLPYKSEKLACILSIVIPGVGEIYANRWINGALTFTLNAIAGVYAIKSFRKDDYITGGLITSFFWHRFYRGGIENAYKSTREYNENLKDRYLRELRKKYNFEYFPPMYRR